MAPAHSRPVLQHINLSQIPRPGKKPFPPANPSGARSQKASSHPQKPQVRPATDSRLNEKGQAWAQEIVEQKAAHARRQQKVQARKKQAPEEQMEAEQEEHGSDSNEIGEQDGGNTDDGEEPEEPQSLIQTQFIIKNSTTRASTTHDGIQTPVGIQSSPISSQRRVAQTASHPTTQSSPGGRPSKRNVQSTHPLDDVDQASAAPHRRNKCAQGSEKVAISQKRKHVLPETSSEDEDSDSQGDIDSSDTPSQPETHTRLPPSKKQKGNTGDGRAKAHDYDGLTLLVLTHAQVEFQVRICTVHAFPEDEDASVWAEECWENACNHAEHTEDLSARQRKLITSRTSTIRGRVKDKVVSKLVSHYGFKPGSKPANIEHNKKLAERLLTDDGYVYEDLATFKGIYDHPILQDVIDDQWFYGKKAEGIVFGASFNPIPDQVIALVFTAVDYAVRRWASGQLVIGTTFNEAAFVDTYERHLAGIEAWRHFSDKSAKGLARQKQRLYNHGRAHAGLPMLGEQERRRFNVDNFARAEQAMAENSDDD